MASKDSQSDSARGAESPSLVLGPEALRLKSMGESMKLSSFEIAQLIAQGTQIDRDVQIAQQKREDLFRREAALIDREDQKWERLLDRDAKDRESMRETIQSRPARNLVSESFRVKIEPFHDKDDIDEYLTHFETVACANSWPSEIWAIRILPLLQGSAREAIKNMPSADVRDYNAVKKALLFRFRKTPEHFRSEFRRYRKKDSETYVQAGDKMINYARKWMLMSGKNPDNLQDVWECFAMEAAYDMLGGGELDLKVREGDPSSFSSLLETADVLAEAKRTCQGSRHSSGDGHSADKTEKLNRDLDKLHL